MSYETSPKDSYSAADAFQSPAVYRSEPDDILRGLNYPPEDTNSVILFQLLAVDETGDEHWIQNEFVFEDGDDIEYKRTLKEIKTLEQEGTVRNLKTFERTSQQEWLY